MQQILTIAWWFTLRPAPLQSSVGRALFMMVPLVFIAVAFVIPLLRRAKVAQALLARMGGSMIRCSVTLGILGLLLTFSRFQSI